MLSDYIIPGNRIELQTYTSNFTDSSNERKSYASKIYDILSEEKIDVMMPMEKGQLQLLPVDGTYTIVFYSDKGLFQCNGRVEDRYRSNNMYILTMELTSPLSKLQRREYYRFSCAINFKFRNLTQDEELTIRDNPFFSLDNDEPMEKGMIVDISGGGIRFISSERFDENTRIFICYQLPQRGSPKDYRIIGQILKTRELENKQGSFEHRVKYTNIDEDDREDIIHYIFEEERKLMRRT